MNPPSQLPLVSAFPAAEGAIAGIGARAVRATGPWAAGRGPGTLFSLLPVPVM